MQNNPTTFKGVSLKKPLILKYVDYKNAYRIIQAVFQNLSSKIARLCLLFKSNFTEKYLAKYRIQLYFLFYQKSMLKYSLVKVPNVFFKSLYNDY